MIHTVESQQNRPAQIKRISNEQRTHGNHQKQSQHFKRPKEIFAVDTHGEIAA